MRFAAAVVTTIVVSINSGCAVVVATGVAVGAVATATVKTAGKVTAATVTTTGRVASAALTSSGEVTALSMESAAKLAKTGMVVLVDGSSGAVTELPWREGLQLYAAVQSGQPEASYKSAKIFRAGRQLAANLQSAREGGGDLSLLPRDVIELKR